MKILLLEEDLKIAAQISEILREHDITIESKSAQFQSKITELNPDILLIDFDLSDKDGILVYREIRQSHPHNKTIMFSSSNSIPLAVAAAKLGVLDFLRKPFDPQLLLDAVSRAAGARELPVLDLSAFQDVEWLVGVSLGLKKTLDEVRFFSSSNNDLIISGDKGINFKVVAEILHSCGGNSDKKFIEINLQSFGSEASEAHLFLTLKELLSAWEKEASIDKKDLPGTIYLSGIENVPESFRLSLVQFVKDKKSPVRIIFSAHDAGLIPNFEVLGLPSLASRREDIPIITLEYLKRFAPKIKYIAPDVLEFFMFYDFPGNYAELRDLIVASAASFPGAEVLNFKSVPIDLPMVKNSLKNKLFSREKYELKKVIWEFEKAWLEIVINKVNGDIHAAARFLDVPKSALVERISTLELQQ